MSLVITHRTLEVPQGNFDQDQRERATRDSKQEEIQERSISNSIIILDDRIK